MAVHTPHTELELSEIISAAKGPFAISGLATKSELGRPVAAPEQLSLAKFSGVTVYEPEKPQPYSLMLVCSPLY